MAKLKRKKRCNVAINEISQIAWQYVNTDVSVREIANLHEVCYNNIHRYMGIAIENGFITRQEYSTAQRIKNSLAKSGENNPNYNGKLVSEKYREKISKAMIGEKNHFYGKNHSQETKEKIKNSKNKIKNLEAKI